MFRDKPKATITVFMTFNGHPADLVPNRFTVHDGDELRIDFPVALTPVVEPAGPGTVLVVREVIRPGIE